MTRASFGASIRGVLVATLVALAPGIGRAQQQAPDLFNGRFVMLDEVHGSLQVRVRSPWVFAPRGQPYEGVQLAAAKDLSALIDEYEYRKGHGKDNWRIGVLLFDLGLAYDTARTVKQHVSVLDAAVSTLAPYVGQNDQVDLVYAQAIDRLARHFAKPEADRSKVAERLIQGVQHLRSRKAVAAEQALVGAWKIPFAEASNYPGLDRFLSLAAAPAGPNACPNDLERRIAQATAAQKAGRQEEARRLAMATATDMIAANKRGCDLEIQHGLDAVLADGSRQPLLADLAEATLRANVRMQPREWSRAIEGSISGYLAQIAEHGTLDQLRAMLMLTQPLAWSTAGLKQEGLHPATVASTFARELSGKEDYASAELMFERLRELRPARAGQETGGWGSSDDVIAAARFHFEHGRRARATELARIALGGFRPQDLDPGDLAHARLVLARNAFDEGDPVRSAEIVRTAAREAAAAANVDALRTLFTFARTLPAAVHEELKPEFTTYAGSMLARFGRDLSTAKELKHDHQPSMLLAIDVAVRYGDRPLLDRAKAVSARSFEWISEERRLPLLLAGDPAAAWFPVTPAASKDSREHKDRQAFKALHPLIISRNYAALNQRLRTIPTPDPFDDCEYGDVAMTKLVVQRRLAGRAPTAAEVEKAADYRLCAGNTAWSFAEKLREQMDQGLFWLKVGEPVVARDYLSKAVPQLIDGAQPNDELAARDPESAVRLAAWAQASFETGDNAAALSTIERATRLIGIRLNASGSGGDRSREAGRFRRSLDRHVEIAAEVSRSSDAQAGEEMRGRALEAMQLGRSTATALATARLTARLAGTDAELSSLIRQRQDMLDLADREAKLLEGAQDDDARQAAARRLAGARRQVEDVAKAIRAKAPNLAEAEDLRPLGLSEIRKAMGPTEALLVSHSTADAVHVAVVTGSVVRLARIEGTRTEIDELVSEFRSGLDIDGTLARFRGELAEDLYRRLIAPFEAEIGGKSHLTLVMDGALESLPFAVLQKRSVIQDARPSYLIERFTISHLPSVRSLATLRSLGGVAPGSETFLGIGDPMLGPPGYPGRQRIASLATRSPDGRVSEMRKMASLPDTAEELRRMSRLLSGKGEHVWLGPEALERRVKAANLADFRTVAFATHAVIPGEIDGVGEPGLVLTPPDRPVGPDDGLLTASEISTLKLSADLVILSACNTASADGRPGADGLSGLARAFIGAGARALVVSHWRVESASTAALMETFALRLAQGDPPAAALRTAMLRRLADAKDENEAHPSLWAPFFVVGAHAAAR